MEERNSRARDELDFQLQVGVRRAVRPLRKTFREAGIVVGSTVKISISGSYKDLYENEIRQMWEPDKVYDMMSMRLREIDLKKKIEERGRLTPERLKQIADSCFAHV